MPNLKKKKNIAILRGGSRDFHRSMKSGANLLLSLLKYDEECQVLDVVIDESGDWFEKGIPSDPHRVFSKADFYIDLTEHKAGEHHQLAEKLDVAQIFRNDFIHSLDRVNVKRILTQLNINAPRYEVIRNDKNLEHKLKEIWTKFHTPIVIKEAGHHFNEKSILTFSFHEALAKSKSILARGGEVILEEHVDGKYLSVVAIPDYRGEEIYMPTPIEVFNLDIKHREVKGKSLKEKYLLEHNHEKRSLVYIDNNLKDEIKRLISEIHKSFLLDFHTLIDIALVESSSQVRQAKSSSPKKYFIKVLELHTLPHLFEDSRFDFIMRNSGVDLGRFILDRVDTLEEEKLSY